MIDWSDPEPDFTRGDVVELRTMADALALIERWEQAHQEAVTAWARLHSDYITMKARAEAWEAIAEHTEFYYTMSPALRQA